MTFGNLRAMWIARKGALLILMVLTLATILSVDLWQTTRYLRLASSPHEATQSHLTQHPQNISPPPTIWHLFGAPQTNDPSLQKPPFAIKGIFQASEVKFASIVIKSSGREKLYKVGAILPDGSKLIEIQQHHVLIEKNKKVKRLPFISHKQAMKASTHIRSNQIQVAFPSKAKKTKSHTKTHPINRRFYFHGQIPSRK